MLFDTTAQITLFSLILMRMSGKGWIHFYFDSYGIFFFDR